MIPAFWFDWVLKATALFAVAGLAAWVLRRCSAAMRHQAWAAALTGALALPLLMWILPAWRAPVMTTVTPAWIEGPALESGTWPERNPAAPAPWITTGELLFAVWLAGFLFLVGRLALGLLHVHRLQRAARALPLASDLPRKIRFLEAATPSVMPMTWGLFRPRVLLPSAWREWPESRLRHVLAHETGHIHRRDWAVQICAELACAVSWFHPLVWLVARGLREEAERACDDLVLARGADASDYAEHLIQLARLMKSPTGAITATLAVARPSSLERRVAAMLNAKLDRRPVSPREKWTYAALTALVLTPLAALAQSIEIRGTVIDPGTNHGIEGAEITVQKMAPREIGRPIRSGAVGKLTTDAQGAFVFRGDGFGEYVLLVKKEGFSPLIGKVVGIPSTQINVVLTKDRPSREVRFQLGRPGEITGRVVDYETGEPIRGFRLNIAPLLYARGLRILWPPFGSGVTDEEGRFRASNLTASQYVAEIRPQLTQREMFLKEFTAEDANAVDQDYELAYLPGGPSLNDALPVQLASGGTADLGTLRARKITHYRVRVSASGCAPGSLVRMLLYVRTRLGGANQAASGETECGQEALFRNLAPGSYFLNARTAPPLAGETADERLQALLSARGPQPPVLKAEVSFAITNRNETVQAALARAPDIAGRFVAAEGARALEWDKLRIASTVLGSVNFGDEAGPVNGDASGNFLLENRLPGIKRITVVGLPPGTFVKQMRYRGTPLAMNIFTFTGEGELEIEIDDQPAVISGTVRDNGRPAEQAHVALIRWPMDPIEPFASITRGNADDDGKFQFSTLPGGEYRLISLAAENRDRLEEPGVLDRLLPRAEKITLTRGASQSVTLAPLDPGR